MTFESFPFVVGWELTLSCNLRCTHCASSAGKPRKRELTRAESIEICDQLPDLLVDEVIFTGGEPLLSNLWEDVSRKLSDRNIKVGMVTNGILMTEGVLKRMSDCGMTAVGISIDGPREVHDHIRRLPGAFETTVRNAEGAAKNGMNVTVITSVTGTNISRLDEIFRLVHAIGAWKWQLQPLFPAGRGVKAASLHLTDREFLSLGEYIQQTRPQANAAGLEIVPADSCGYYSVLDLPEFEWHGCGAGRFSCGIMSDGRIKGCLSWPDTIIEGDLHTDSLWTIWFRPGAFSHLRDYTVDDMAGYCADCEVALECGGGCQAMSLAATGVFHSDPYCYRRILNEMPGGRPRERAKGL
jgi:radical SAM protein with 4Fe4S-binding SPASM domain